MGVTGAQWLTDEALVFFLIWTPASCGSVMSGIDFTSLNLSFWSPK